MKSFVIVLFVISFALPLIVNGQATRPTMTGMQRGGTYMMRNKPTREQKRMLAPDEKHRIRYAAILEQPRSGLIRLMPDIGCTENAYIIRADEKCLKFIPESAFYSFREKEHTIELLADIRFRNGYLITDGILSQGIMVNLGPTDVAAVDDSHRGLRYMIDFEPASDDPGAQKQFLQIMRGVKSDGFHYKKALPVSENSTYALRVIAYRGNIYRRMGRYRFDLLDGDKRIDVLLAFRVLSKDADGGITLLWREISRRSAPRLVKPKRRG